MNTEEIKRAAGKIACDVFNEHIFSHQTKQYTYFGIRTAIKGIELGIAEGRKEERKRWPILDEDGSWNIPAEHNDEFNRELNKFAGGMRRLGRRQLAIDARTIIPNLPDSALGIKQEHTEIIEHRDIFNLGMMEALNQIDHLALEETARANARTSSDTLSAKAVGEAEKGIMKGNREHPEGERIGLSLEGFGSPDSHPSETSPAADIHRKFVEDAFMTIAQPAELVMRSSRSERGYWVAVAEEAARLAHENGVKVGFENCMVNVRSIAKEERRRIASAIEDKRLAAKCSPPLQGLVNYDCSWHQGVDSAFSWVLSFLREESV
jgi:hypothetical protein